MRQQLHQSGKPAGVLHRLISPFATRPSSPSHCSENPGFLPPAEVVVVKPHAAPVGCAPPQLHFRLEALGVDAQQAAFEAAVGAVEHQHRAARLRHNRLQLSLVHLLGRGQGEGLGVGI